MHFTDQPQPSGTDYMGLLLGVIALIGLAVPNLVEYFNTKVR